MIKLCDQALTAKCELYSSA